MLIRQYNTLLSWITIVLQLVIICNGQYTPETVTDAQHRFADRGDVYDQEHIKQHLENKIDVEQAPMTPEQERFHYFSLHDLNKDGRIDGIEIIKATNHQHDETADKPPLPGMDETQLESLVDSILKEIDINDDGYIDFAEYSRSLSSDNQPAQEQQPQT